MIELKIRNGGKIKDIANMKRMLKDGTITNISVQDPGWNDNTALMDHASG
jgi:hypothetical protein